MKPWLNHLVLYIIFAIGVALLVVGARLFMADFRSEGVEAFLVGVGVLVIGVVGFFILKKGRRWISYRDYWDKRYQREEAMQRQDAEDDAKRAESLRPEEPLP